MAEKAPCRWFEVRKRENFSDRCAHPVVMHLCGGTPAGARCHGCPCHEPEPAKDTQRTDPPQVHDKP